LLSVLVAELHLVAALELAVSIALDDREVDPHIAGNVRGDDSTHPVSARKNLTHPR
jgi:hypothetical protein